MRSKLGASPIRVLSLIEFGWKSIEAIGTYKYRFMMKEGNRMRDETYS